MSALFKITHKQTLSASALLLTSHQFWNLVPVSGPLRIPVLLMKKVKESRKSGSSYVRYCVTMTSSDRGGRWWTWVSFSDGLAGRLLEWARHVDESHTGCIDKHTHESFYLSGQHWKTGILQVVQEEESKTRWRIWNHRQKPSKSFPLAHFFTSDFLLRKFDVSLEIRQIDAFPLYVG